MCGSASWKVLLARCSVSGTDMTSSGDTTPDSSAAAAVITLLADPGSYTSWTARSTREATVDVE